MNIITTTTGFKLNDLVYTWKDDVHTEIICDTQTYAFMEEATLLLDLFCKINGVTYTNINEFTQNL